MELKINLQLDEELGDILWVEFALDLTQINSQFYYDKYQYFVLKNFVFMQIIENNKLLNNNPRPGHNICDLFNS